MNFIGFTLISIITFIITQFAGSQIIGILLYMLPKKKYSTLIGLFLWLGVLIGYYFVITRLFHNYYRVYFWATIISLIIVVLNIKNLKNETLGI